MLVKSLLCFAILSASASAAVFADDASPVVLVDNLSFESPVVGHERFAVEAPLHARRSLAPRTFFGVEFREGVASGDPLADRVVLWTRLTVPDRWANSIGALVKFQVAADADFGKVAAWGLTWSNNNVDWTVKVDVSGLKPNTRYFYRFVVNGVSVSPVGVTRTLPASTADVEQLKVAVFSCSNLPFGFFNAYGRVAAKADIDLVLHLG
jgi:alkaline phosphatase D